MTQSLFKKGFQRFSVFFLLFNFGSILQAQNVGELIDAKKEQLEKRQLEIDNILVELEELKLQRIIEDLRGYLPKPIEHTDEEIVEHAAMILSYNETHEQANWVIHMITKDILYGTTGRTNDFRPDPKVSTGSSDKDDYWYSGFDRGHLAPSADFRWSRKALSESYYYSNMSPQIPGMNRGAWAKLENQVREWAIDFGEVVIVTGPILKDDLPKVPQGSERVSIPEAYYKIVLVDNDTLSQGIAFLFPNEDVEYVLPKYTVTIDSVEKVSGLHFFAGLENATEIKTSADLSVWPSSSSKMESARLSDTIPSMSQLHKLPTLLVRRAIFVAQ